MVDAAALQLAQENLEDGFIANRHHGLGENVCVGG
jgi:hypothetical protein